MKSFHFKANPDQCIHCGRCVASCSSVILYFDEQGVPKMKAEADGIVGWDGCYRCQHCLAVCPTGAISIFDKDPKDSLLPEEGANARQLEALMRNRRACRRYQDREVPREEIDQMLRLLENVRTGSNLKTLCCNVVYRKAEMDKLRKLVREEAFRLAEQGIYPGSFTKSDWEKQLEWEPGRNPGDMFFVNAPHILVIHSQRGRGQWQTDPVLAAAWFDLICASHGLGSIIMSYPVGALSHMPEVEKLLQIPQDRYYSLILGFGYPEYPYARGVQREGIAQIKELTF